MDQLMFKTCTLTTRSGTCSLSHYLHKLLVTFVKMDGVVTYFTFTHIFSHSMLHILHTSAYFKIIIRSRAIQLYDKILQYKSIGNLPSNSQLEHYHIRENLVHVVHVSTHDRVHSMHLFLTHELFQS